MNPRLLPIGLLLSSSWLGGCYKCEAPTIDGSSAERRAIASETVDEFRDALGTQRVCVPMVRFVPDIAEVVSNLDHAFGAYNKSSRRIFIDDGLTEDEDISKVVRHELCHAADYQNGLIRSASSGAWVDDGLSREEKAELHQNYATTCAIGPAHVQILGARCAQDTEGVAAISELENLFTEPSSRLRTDVDWQQIDVASAPLANLESSTLSVWPTVNGGLRIETVVDEVVQWTFVSLADGSPRLAEPLSQPTARRGVEDGWSYRSWADANFESLFIAVAKAPNDTRATRIVHHSWAGFYSRVDCARQGESVFAYDDQLWSAWIEDDAVWWGRWIEE